MYIFLSEVRLEEKEGYKSYLRITPECFDELFYKIGYNMKGESAPKLKLDAKTFRVPSFVVSFLM